MHILIIEDDPAIQQTLRDLLEINGHVVSSADTGGEGIRLAAHSPDAIFCDLTLPDIDGEEVLTVCRRMPAAECVPFIILTARAGHDNQRKGMTLGADDYITKPFSEKEILQALQARVARTRPFRERLDQLRQQRDRELSADWSHELLTPLNAVIGGLDMLAEELETTTANPAQRRELLSILRWGVEEQYRFARQLIRFFELEACHARGTTPPRGEVEVEVAVQAALGRAARTGGPPPRIRLDYLPAHLAVPVDWLVDALSELLDNARRLSPTDAEIVLHGGPTGDRYFLEVSDTGPGLRPEQRTAIGPFVQFGRAPGIHRGLGLGLSIARHVAVLTGGRLDLLDGPGGRGLTVRLELPLVDTAEASFRHHPEEKAGLDGI